MTKLALDGGRPAVKTPIPSFNYIGKDEIDAAARAMSKPLSGFLGGELRGGSLVRKLEDLWCEKFGVTHAIACNSATSGLLAACVAVGVKKHDPVLVSPFTMSATAAAPRFLGADINFIDIEPNYFCMDPSLALQAMTPHVKAIIPTNLFGHPAELQRINKIAHLAGAYMIEDNAQGILAMEDNVYAGTVGDIGVFSLNVHKHLNCGEGGIVVTDNDEFADAIRRFINHGEMAGDTQVGLNLRMTEVSAAIAIEQLRKVYLICSTRVMLAEALKAELHGLDIVSIAPPRNGCRHSYYVLPMIVHEDVNRGWLVDALKAEGVPIVEGYVEPLYMLDAFARFGRSCPVAERMHSDDLIYFEICGHDPSTEQIKQIGEAFRKVQEVSDSKRRSHLPADMAHR